MSYSQDDYISRYLGWHRSTEGIRGETEMTKDQLNLAGSNNSQHDSDNDFYQRLCELRQQQINDQNKSTIYDLNHTSLIAPNHAFWNYSTPSELPEVPKSRTFEHESIRGDWIDQNLSNMYQTVNTENRHDNGDSTHQPSHMKLPTYNLKPTYDAPDFGPLVPSYPPPGYYKDQKANSATNTLETPPSNSQELYNINQKMCTKNEPQRYNYDSLNLCSQALEKKATGVWMFVDNSNIWIECKRAEAKLKFKKNPLFDEDPRLRLDMGRLAEQVRGGRPIIDAQLYGSEPPEVDTIWQLATK